MRVWPSSSSVTRKGPREARAASTGTASGRSIQAAAATSAAPTAIQARRRAEAVMTSLPGLQDLDEIEAIDAPADREGRQGGGARDDGHGERDGRRRHHERNAEQLGLEPPDDQRAQPVADRGPDGNRDH